MITEQDPTAHYPAGYMQMLQQEERMREETRAQLARDAEALRLDDQHPLLAVFAPLLDQYGYDELQRLLNKARDKAARSHQLAHNPQS